MRVTQELITVLPDVDQHEISILLAGLRISLSGDEARILSTALAEAMKRVWPDGATGGHSRNTSLAVKPVEPIKTSADKPGPEIEAKAVAELRALMDDAPPKSESKLPSFLGGGRRASQS